VTCIQSVVQKRKKKKKKKKQQLSSTWSIRTITHELQPRVANCHWHRQGEKIHSQRHIIQASLYWDLVSLLLHRFGSWNVLHTSLLLRAAKKRIRKTCFQIPPNLEFSLQNIGPSDSWAEETVTCLVEKDNSKVPYFRHHYFNRSCRNEEAAHRNNIF